MYVCINTCVCMYVCVYFDYRREFAGYAGLGTARTRAGLVSARTRTGLGTARTRAGLVSARTRAGLGTARTRAGLVSAGTRALNKPKERVCGDAGLGTALGYALLQVVL